jgi:hypothetical protein
MSVPITSPGSIELEQRIANEEQVLKSLMVLEHIASQEKMNIERAILDLEVKKKDLAIALGKARHTRAVKEVEIKLLTGQFWSAKKSGT